jgi:hypothetical protein
VPARPQIRNQRTVNRRVVQIIIDLMKFMAIFNFQKPDKVIMIDSTDFEGIKILDLLNQDTD